MLKKFFKLYEKMFCTNCPNLKQHITICKRKKTKYIFTCVDVHFDYYLILIKFLLHSSLT